MKKVSLRGNLAILACIVSGAITAFYFDNTSNNTPNTSRNTHIDYLSAYNYTPKIAPKIIKRYDPLIEYKEPEFRYDIDADELKCLALNVYFESRGESILGQRAVAWATFNRVDSPIYPNTICDVVWENKQFSWTHDGKSDEPKDLLSWMIALYVALDVYKDHTLGYSFNDPTYGATMFHASYMTPDWADDFAKIAHIDDHVFYK
jgi:spore germination cell wall hydrolase CwlJ-like protein